MRVIELRDDHHGLEAFVVVDHDQFPIAAGGTRMLPDVDVGDKRQSIKEREMKREMERAIRR